MLRLLILKLRVSKEKSSYEREVVANENKLEKMKQEGKDEYEIKKQVRQIKGYELYGA